MSFSRKDEAYKHAKYKYLYKKQKKQIEQQKQIEQHKQMIGGQPFTPPTFGSLRPTDILNEQSAKAHKSGYDLLTYMMSYYPTGKMKEDIIVMENSLLVTKSRDAPQLQIATSESLTAGLMFSTLVDIPWGGYLKYGCFGVYDTNAKRVFNGVTIDDVYTHKCAKQMAVGILLNSNATIGLAVTGNAMPLNEHANMLGEVFIGVAGYGDDNKIIVKTKAINACKDFADLLNICKIWYGRASANTYNDREMTSIVSNIIRNYTTERAFEFCLEFIKNTNPIVPNFVIKNKTSEESRVEKERLSAIPNAKYPDRKDLSIECLNDKNQIDDKNRCSSMRLESDELLHGADDPNFTSTLSADSFKGKYASVEHVLRASSASSTSSMSSSSSASSTSSTSS